MPYWQFQHRPGYLGKNRDPQFAAWTKKYGINKWRLWWKIGEATTGLVGACALYEDAYFHFLHKRPDILDQLLTEARDVYDDAPSNVESGLDYTRQETDRTHLQDVAIRRALVRMGKTFHGSELIQIRDCHGIHPLSMMLSPGRVPFHRVDLIEQTELLGWWQPKSVEAFYQSNKYLQILVETTV